MTPDTPAPANVAGAPRLAGWWRRFFAWLYELLLLVPVILLAGIPALALQAVLQSLLGGVKVDGVIDTPFAHMLNFAWLMAVSFFYFAWCWRRGGQTLAMKTWRVRILAVNGQPVSLRAAAIRFFAAFACWFPLIPLWMLARRDPQWIPYAWFSFGLFLAPFFWAFADREKQLLHDRLAGTRLVFAPSKRKPFDPLA
ncbi:hypothetical protein IGB42_01728 [Andreprevotia sp. IGB-42]|uniref:RDD family protein n=1 Tax=Andreprevotia sp. IGB-42 TaxID=2497473 RepID=UPI00135884C7|nr:RDD family protein [Andreprevotia sp. IGB-42]KAF0814048.1 hypothetical protein IGB42_01728 [Andreprevotia sp. IGB-42]